MIMDPRFDGFWDPINGVHTENQFLSNQNLIDGGGQRFVNTFFNHNMGEIPILPSYPSPNNTVSTVTSEEDPHEDCDFSDTVLRYINQMLMEEDMEDKTCMLQESLDLQAAEKSFYDVLGKKYPPSPERIIPNDYLSGNRSTYSSFGSSFGDNLTDPYWFNNASSAQSVPLYNFASSSFSSLDNIRDGFLNSPISPLQAADFYNGSQSMSKFKEGLEEASKFLPSSNNLLVGFYGSNLSPQENTGVAKKKEGQESSASGLKVRKNLDKEEGVDSEEEGKRSSKQAAAFPEPIVRSEMFDDILLCNKDKPVLQAYREALKDSTITSQKSGGKKRNSRKKVVDWRTLLIHCAQAVAADDHKNAKELLKQVRMHTTPCGDGNQRLAHCFANGLEARMAGTGSQIYKALLSKRTTAADYLKAYQLYLACCPFRKISNFVSNRTIRIKAGNSMRLHIIDFGILYGFQWPTFIQRISRREGGPPMLRITGIEFPQPGFRPAAGVEETGRRLADYARSFNVPFEYNAIAKKWDTIQLEELKIIKDEVVIVNCLYRAKNLHDETVLVDSPRASVLKLISKIKPDLFVHGITNGAYNAPFFVTRFREALFHFSALFDMLETNVPREHHERILIESEIFGKDALNVIACEGWERVERPETYRQWQVRNLRAGLVQVPLEREMVKMAKERVSSSYHEDFVIDEDGHWLLQGWKGRIIYAISCWKPV